MPNIIMHHHFGRVVHSGLSEKVQKEINMNLYDFSTNVPDVFKYLNWYKKKKRAKSQEITNKMHNQNTQKYLLEMTNQCCINHDLFPFLCGNITHYFLDVLTNPYIYYQSGEYDLNIYNTVKYRGLNEKLKKAMDAYIIENYYESNPNTFRIRGKVLKLRKVPKNISIDIDSILSKVYGIENGYTLLNKALKNQRSYFLWTYDPIGFTNFWLSKFDNGRSPLDLRMVSMYNKKIQIGKYDIFNIKQAQWFNPVTGEDPSIESFFNLFDKAKVYAIQCIEKLYKYIFEDQKDVDLTFYFKDLSYRTGQPCGTKGIMTHFTNIFK